MKKGKWKKWLTQFLKRMGKDPNKMDLDKMVTRIESLPQGRRDAIQHISKPGYQSKAHLQKDFEKSWANYLRRNHITDQSPGKIGPVKPGDNYDWDRLERWNRAKYYKDYELMNKFEHPDMHRDFGWSPSSAPTRYNRNWTGEGKWVKDEWTGEWDFIHPDELGGRDWTSDFLSFKKGGTIKKNTPLSVKKKGGATPGMRKGGGLKKDKNGRFYR